MARKELAIIGGGAKAAAIAAKAYCLRSLRLADVHVTIFEKHALAANWDGKHGYTDGLQPLCTPAERDLGFPYDRSSFGPGVVEKMQAEFSWMSYSVRSGLDPEYADWVNRGSKPPTHGQFAEYLRDSILRTEPQIEYGEVVRLMHEGGSWHVSMRNSSTGVEEIYSPFDGVVVTSPGPPARRFRHPADPRVFDGHSFWANLSTVEALARTGPGPIAIVGGGGTAAAIAAWLVRHRLDSRGIVIVADQAALYARPNNFFENRLFSDEDAWAVLTPKDRVAFTDRLTRGVVWENVTELLATSTRLALRPGRAKGIDYSPASGSTDAPELSVLCETSSPGNPDFEVPASLIIDASGFDNRWFLGLLDPALADGLRGQITNLVSHMPPDLTLSSPAPPNLHVPFISQASGPGFTSLMVLGSMADRILRPYI